MGGDVTRNELAIRLFAAYLLPIGRLNPSPHSVASAVKQRELLLFLVHPCNSRSICGVCLHVTSPLPYGSECGVHRRIKMRRIESFFLRKRLRNDLHKGEQSKICHLFHFLRGKNDHLFRFLPEIHHPEHQVAHREAGG